MTATGRDTIAAVSTAPGRSGVALVRVSGPGVEEILGRLGLEPLEPRRVTYARIRHPEDGKVVERGLVTRFAAPASFTGEEMAEIGCHGGALAPRLVLDALCAAGARPASPGEFTRRAFLNGKIDLVQAEAIGDLVESRTEMLHEAALFQLEGGLSRRIEELRGRLVDLQGLLAYDIDFPEEDDGPVSEERITRAHVELLDRLDGLLRHAPEGELLREGALTVIAGRPNTGKSSLFNSLLGEERAIVTEVPGTTRDAIEALVSVEGYPFRLVDTAGLRSSTDRIEWLGIEVARRYLERADLVLFCWEAARQLSAEEAAFLEELREAGDGRGNVLRVRTKAELAGESDGEPGAGGAETREPEVHVSSRRGRGMDELRRRMLGAAFRGTRSRGEAPLVTRRRHVRALEEAREEVVAFGAARADGLPAEVAVTHLLAASRKLEELLGVVDTEQLLDSVFASFCVGK